QLEETQLSIDFVRNHFNPDELFFSFPFTDDGVNTHVLNSLQNELGIHASFGTAGIKNERVKNHYQRIPMENEASTASMTITQATIKSAIRSALGLNTINRN